MHRLNEVTSVQGQLTPELLCCASGLVDECGVCDGINSCRTVISARLTADTAVLSTGPAQVTFASSYTKYVCTQLQMTGYCSLIDVKKLSAASRRRELLSSDRALLATATIAVRDTHQWTCRSRYIG